MRIAHLADIHVKDRRRDEYAAVFDALVADLAAAEAFDCIAIAGDVFDSMSRASANNWKDVATLLDRLADVAPVVVIPGNHDFNVRAEGAPDLIRPMLQAAGGARNLQEPRVTFWRDSGVYEHGGAVWAVGVPGRGEFPEAAAVAAALEGKPATVPVVGLYHESVGGAKFPNGQKAEGTPLNKSDFTAIAAAAGGGRACAFLLGDIHLRQEVTFEGCGAHARAWYPGSLVCQTFGEPHIGHGYLEWAVVSGDAAAGAAIEVTPHEIANDHAPLTLRLNAAGRDTTADPRPKHPRSWRVIHDPATPAARVREFTTEAAALFGKPPRSVEAYRAYGEAAEGGDEAGGAAAAPGTIAHVHREVNEWARHEKAAREILADTAFPEKIVDKAVARYKDEVEASLGAQAAAPQVEFVRLEFDNMFCFGAGNVVDFDEIRAGRPGVVGLIADNYMGKSSIFDILSFAMCDEFPRGGKRDIARVGGPGYRLLLRFRVDGVEGCVEKSGLSGALKRTENRISLRLGGEDLTADTAPETAQRAREILGSRRWLDSVVFLRPQSVTGVPSFAAAAPAERRRLLSTILNLGSYEALLKAADAEIRGLRGERRASLAACAAGLDRPPKSVPEGGGRGLLVEASKKLAAEVRELAAAAKETASTTEARQAAWEEAAAALKEVEIAAATRQAAVDECLRAFRRAERDIDDAMRAHQRVQSDLAAAQHAAADEADARAAVAEAAESAAAGAGSQDAQRRLAALGPAPPAVELAAAKALTEGPRPEPPAAAEKEAAIEELARARAALEQQRKEVAAARADRAAKAAKARKALGLVGISDVPVAEQHSPPSPGAYDRVLKLLKKFSAASKTRAIRERLKPRWVATCPGCKATRTLLGDNSAEILERCRAEGAKALAFLGADPDPPSAEVQKRVEAAEQKRVALAERTTGAAAWDRAEALARAHEEREALAGQGGNALAQKRLEEAQARLRAAVQASGRLETLTAEETRLAAEVSRLADSHEEAKQALEGAREAAGDGAADAAARELERAAARDLEAARQAQADARTKATTRSMEARVFNDHARRAIEADDKVAVCAAYRLILHPKNGVGARFLETAVAGVTAEIEAALLAMAANITIEFTADYVMALVDRKTGNRVPPSLGSGYQQFALAIAARWAFSQVARVPIPACLMIDEGFGALDAHNLERVAEALNMLAQKGPRAPGMPRPVVIAVTHLESMSAYFSASLRIKRARDVSYLRYPADTKSTLAAAKPLPAAAKPAKATGGGGGAAAAAAAAAKSAAAKHHCEACEKDITATHWPRHEGTATHKKCVAARAERDEAIDGDPSAEAAPNRRVRCLVCKLEKTLTPKQWLKHVMTLRHQNHVDDAAK